MDELDYNMITSNRGYGKGRFTLGLRVVTMEIYGPLKIIQRLDYGKTKSILAID